MPMMTSESHARDVQSLIASALDRPAAEGARIVALLRLVQLVRASARWNEVDHVEASDDARGTDARGTDARATDALHDARVALRRLRATLREFRAVLASSLRRRDTRSLRTLQQDTSRMRDRDVHLRWLAEHRERMNDAARGDADVLATRLRPRVRRAHRVDARAFSIAVELTGDALADRLSHFTVSQRVGEAPHHTPFAALLAERLDRCARRLRRALRNATDAAATGRVPDWHRIRLLLKRQRAMLASFTEAHPAVAACCASATDGQDAIGGMRDALLLASRADRRRLDALVEYALDVAADQHDRVERWANAADAHWQHARAAIDALHTIAAFHSIAASPPEAPVVSAPPASSSADPLLARALPTIPDGHGLPMEIERKFLLHGLPPEAAAAPSQLIEQGWLPGTLLRERLRRTLGPEGAERLTRTIKLGRPGSRIEVEEPTDPVLFSQLWPLTVNARIRKRRHLVPFGALTWEIDVFLDRDLVLAELELTDEAQAFDIPAWLQPFVVKDVTSDPAYLNSVMAQRDVPAPDRIAR